jgi:hypothetical protein
MESQEIPKNITSPAKYRRECILLSIVFSEIFREARKAVIFTMCVCVCERERERERENEPQKVVHLRQ